MDFGSRYVGTGRTRARPGTSSPGRGPTVSHRQPATSGSADSRPGRHVVVMLSDRRLGHLPQCGVRQPGSLFGKAVQLLIASGALRAR